MVRIGENSVIHPTSILGLGALDGDPPVTIGRDVRIEAFCVVEPGATIGDGVEITHHCVVGRDASIGPRTKLVDSVRVARSARIGADCIVGGNVSDRAQLGDRVTFMGEMAHSHRDATIEWGVVEEPSPTIHEGTVVAQGAWIVGGISVGPNAYISMGEIVKTDVLPNMLVSRGRHTPLAESRGFIRARGQ